MAFKISERFEVQAPVERVWKYLIDPASVVQCLPGAELLETNDDGTFVGQIKVKVGPLSMSYKGKGSFTEKNDETHMARMVGEAREVGGSGSTKVTMVSTVTALEGGSSAVSVDADINLVGRIVQFGRGMIEEVSRQMFRQFATCVKGRLEVEEPSHPESPSTNSEPTASADAGATSSAVAASTPEPATRSAVPETKPISATSVGLRAMWAIIARFFKRLVGKREQTIN
ncbi:MAG TPA: SRPBCC family protein [Pyrinomonadaceae bacterium]|nr:SRPBCC family protein [Pyrinomonadaceae bacterium]